MLELIEAIYTAIDRPSQLRATPRMLAEALNATAYSISQYAPGENASKRIATWGLDHELLSEYDSRWAPHDPLRRRTIAQLLEMDSEKCLSAVHLAPLVTPEEVRQLPVFTEFYARLNVQDGVLIPFAARDSFMWIVLFCNAEKGVFSSEEIECATRIGPHLQRASRLIENRSNVNRHFRNGALADFGAPALILNRKGEVVDSNTSFKEIIGARAGGRFRLGDKSVSASLEKFFNATDADSAYEGVMVETDSDWRLRFHRFDTLEDLFGDCARADTCLVLFERDQDAAYAAASLKFRFDLTETESEIVALILSGRTPRQIADLRNCSVSTVRWHMRQIYSKMGVTSRAELAARVKAS
ncbi:MAG: helix-turn-helix transcriptional regulator [Parvularculaceae bacterium]|nr:helix-turn-helix transcriptional regulator [Parvularculaceae bacterium]